ncbi:MAG TPA: GNAT family N-acetyltransferase [Gaiellaceae bacterium]|nr:GNAT family N-acetyltransferase [Gaiellaceae bacterium]
MGLLIRRAEPEAIAALRELTFRSKAHWGYEPALVRAWVDGLSFSTDKDYWLAEVDGTAVAWMGLVPSRAGVCVLDDLWVDPAWLGQGIGRKLFLLAVDAAAELGARRLEWGAEPNAVGFYEQVGGRKLRDHVTEWGRVAPWMGIDL